MKKALVTGANSFTGRYMVRRLQDAGCEVFALGRKPVEGCQYLPLPHVDDKDRIYASIRKTKPDYLIHLAGVVVTTNYVDAFLVNTVFGHHLLESLEKSGLDAHTRVLFVGSAAEYGRTFIGDLPLTEKHCAQPFSIYGISKLAQTYDALKWAESCGRFLVVARPFTIMGSGMPQHLSIGSFAKQINSILKTNGTGELITGNLNTHRDFLHVEDVVDIYWKLLNTSDFPSQLVNVCSGKPLKLLDIVEYMLEIAGREIKIRLRDELLRVIDDDIHYGDNSKLLNIIGPYKFTSWRTSIEQMIENETN